MIRFGESRGDLARTTRAIQSSCSSIYITWIDRDRQFSAPTPSTGIILCGCPIDSSVFVYHRMFSTASTNQNQQFWGITSFSNYYEGYILKCSYLNRSLLKFLEWNLLPMTILRIVNKQSDQFTLWDLFGPRIMQIRMQLLEIPERYLCSIF